ncbi:MAG: uroporphyrinogen-III C-methyltransferase [Gammaproteobacteria bacterium]|jgi:uroporphyrin-3 C-methyltransferase|nr:uroporphyrinogen-III C-methyltransferase [Gammaproteobacteria bacterium]
MTDKQDTKGTQAGSGGQAKETKVAAVSAGKASKPAPAATTKKPAAHKTAPKSAAGARPAPAKGGRMAGFVALVALLFAAYAAYQSWLTGQQIKNLDQDNQTQFAAQQSLANKVTLAGSEVATLQANWQQQRQALLAQQQAMEEALQQALQQMAQAQSEQQQQLPKWELAEAEYLLRLANQRLAMEQNPAAAVALLQAADEIMRTSEQLGSYGVRQAIAKDIGALTAVSVADVEGLYARLAGLLEQSSGLAYIAPTATSVLVQEPVAETIAVQPEVALSWDQKAWQTAGDILHNTWQELKVLVRIQERTNADQLLLTPDIEALLRMRLQLSLTQAQAALVRGQSGIYQSSLQQVARILRDYYRSTDPVVSAMSSQVAQLSQIQLLIQMPDISSSLYALQDLQAAIHAQQGD